MLPACKWVFDTGGSGRGAWGGGFGYRLATRLRPLGRYPDILAGSSIGGFTALDLATGDPEVLYNSWSNWKPDIPADVTLTPDERGFYGLFSFRKTVKQSIHFTLDPATEDKLFDPGNPIRLFLVTSRLGLPGGNGPSAVQLWQMCAQVLTREWRHKYIPRRIGYTPRVFVRGVEGDAGPLARPLTRANVRHILMATCLLPLIMGRPVRLEGEQLVDGGFTRKIPLFFRPWPGGEILDEWAAACKTLVIANNPEGRLWQTSMRLGCWNDEPEVREAISEGRLLVVHPPEKLRIGTVTRDPVRTMYYFNQGQESAESFLREDSARRFFEL
jgi:hypothetical protein